MTPTPHKAQDGPPLAALLFRPGPGLTPEALRVARALLEDAARNRGGRVSPAGEGGWRLTATPPALEMARRALSAVLHGRDAALLTEAVAAPGASAAANGIEALLAGLPLQGLLERRPILGFGADGAAGPVGLRVLPSAAAIAAAITDALGPRWAAEPWQAHGRDLVARRALALAAPSAVPLHLDLPPEALPAVPQAGEGAAFLAILPPRALARPPSGRFGTAWPLGAALALVDPGCLRGEVLHLSRDAALDALPGSFWQAVGPGRVVLEGVADSTGLSWGLSRGIARFAGPWPERLLAVRRRREAQPG